MMPKIKIESLLSGIGLASRYATKAILIIIVGRGLSTNELAGWYVILSLIGMFLIAEGGLRQIGIRGISFRLKNQGRNDSEAFTFTLILSYVLVAIFIAFLAILFGINFLEENRSTADLKHIKEIWILFVLGSMATLGTSLASSIMMGKGNIKIAQMGEAIINIFALVVLVIYAFAINKSSNLVVISYAVNIPLIAGLLFYILFLKPRNLLCFDALAAYNIDKFRSHIREILPSYSYMIANIASYNILTSFVILFLSENVSPVQVAGYGLSQQILVMAMAFSSISINNTFNLIAERNIKSRNIAVESIKTGLLSMIAMSILLNILGGEIIKLIGFKSGILSGVALILFTMTLVVEYAATLYGQVLTACSLEKLYVFSNILFSVLFLVSLYIVRLFSVDDIVFMLSIRLTLAIVVFLLPVYIISKKKMVV